MQIQYFYPTNNQNPLAGIGLNYFLQENQSA